MDILASLVLQLVQRNMLEVNRQANTRFTYPQDKLDADTLQPHGHPRPQELDGRYAEQRARYVVGAVPYGDVRALRKTTCKHIMHDARTARPVQDLG